MSFIGKVFSGLNCYHKTINSESDAQNIYNIINTQITALDKQDSIVSLTMIPSVFWKSPSALLPDPFDEDFTISHITQDGERALVGGYKPKNKKLLTYPYNYLCIDVLNDSHIYKYEDFNVTYGSDNNDFKFNVINSLSPDMDIVISPVSYRGSGGGVPNYCESVSMSGFPQCAYSIDSYRAWLAQKGNAYNLTQMQNMVGVGAGIATAGVGVATANPMVAGMGVTAAINAGFNMSQAYNQMTIETTRGSRARGNQDASTLVGSHAKAIYARHLSVKRSVAEVFDDYFSRFGYACQRIKVPNRHVRQSWTYTKTIECSLTANCPSDDIAKIKSIYNRGITFWDSAATIGDYSQSNNPLPRP